ncbi:MAG TPA: YbhB/YbcL family Raf kinase inhibitor-like protein [Blastocatellia bacterium]
MRLARPALSALSGLLIPLLLAGCGKGGSSSNEIPSNLTMSLTSEAFSDDQQIPREYTCDGANVSPPLKWGGAPAGAKSFVLICEDIDAPFGVFVHWVVYNIPVSVSRLPRQVPTDQVLSDGARQSQNDFDHTGYGGPCPPHGKHRYVFHVYAVDIVLDQGSLKRDAVDKAIKNHILAQGQLTGTYQRG